MQTESPDILSIRNVALLAHGGGGKTTLAEALLFNGQAIDRRGEVGTGTAVMSTEAEELERGITITPHVGYCSWRNHWFNLVDTPGYVDFLESTRSVMQVVGGAVMIISGQLGVKPENMRLWSMAEEAQVAMIGFINKLDKPRTDFIRVLGDIEQSLKVTALPLTIPIGVGEAFAGIIDLIPMTAWSAKNGQFTQIDFPESVRADALHYRTRLVEQVVEADDQLLEKYLESGEEPDEATLHAGLRKAVHERRLFLLFCGSGLANIGVRALANGIVYYLPNPVEKADIKSLVGENPDQPGEQIKRSPLVTDPFSAIVFKTTIDPFAGKLSIVRVFSGRIETDQPFYNSDRKVKERGGRLFRLQGKEMRAVSQLQVGEIGAIAKLEETRSGDTLCAVEQPIHYQRVCFQEPVLSFAVEADSQQEDRVAIGLSKLTEEDPTLQFFRDGETHEMILAGMGQTHLRVTLDRLKRKFGVTATLKMPKVPYRESISRPVRVQGRLKKQSGGRGQFGDCWLEVEPLPRGGGYHFEDRIVGGAIPRQYIPSVEKGIQEELGKGLLGGYPVVDVKVVLVDGSFHPVDSSDNAFRAAGGIGFRKAMEEGGAILLEPIMTMEITVPDDVLGDVIGDLNSRRGRITGVTPRVNNQSILAETPMAEVLDYGNVLNAITSGRGLYTMRVTGYQEVPSHISRQVLVKKTDSK
ncbi:MAG: elongation factor G [Magnetococcales bacterium]|nr:elongation factor G [Magnetococcales bacterium]